MDRNQQWVEQSRFRPRGIEPSNVSFERYYYQKGSGRKIQGITATDENMLYLSTSKGVLRFDTQKQEFTESYFVRDADSVENKNDISGGILLSSPDTLLIGSNEGITVLSLKDSIVAPYSAIPASESSLSRINTMLRDGNGNVWIGSHDGLTVRDATSGHFQTFVHDFKDPTSLSHNKVHTLYEDRSGIVWVGTQSGGLNKYDPNRIKFPLTYPEINLASDQIRRSFISALTTSDGHTWIGNDSGLYEFHKDSLINSFTPSERDTGIPRGGVTGLEEMRNGDIMVAIWGGGLNRLDRKTGLFHRYGYSFEEGMTSNDRLSCCITDMLKDGQGVLWLSTIYGFLERFDSESGTFQSFKIGEWIWEMWLDGNTGTMFLATENGLALFDVENKGIEHFVSQGNEPGSISHNSTWAVFNDSRNRIWVGTYNGLEEFDRTKETFILHTDPTLNRLTVYTIQEDDTGDLWLGTHSGISKFDVRTKTFLHFTSEDGAYPESKWSYKDAEGNMIFGGPNGFSFFEPSSIDINRRVPEVVFTDFKVFNESVEPGPESLLKKHVDLSREVTLPYDANVFSIAFAALNYSSSTKNKYAYKLEGFDQNWNPIGSERTASYTNLNPGDYTFHVKASNNDRVWNESGATLSISVTPPFWVPGGSEPWPLL